MSITSLLDLPLEVLVNLFRYLQIKDLRKLMITCKTLRNFILNDNFLWKVISKNRLIVHDTDGNSKNASLSWYNLVRISHNWCNGIYTDKRIINHNTNYMPWLKYVDSHYLLLSCGSQLRSYSLDKKGFNCKNVWHLDVPIIKRGDIRTNDISRFLYKNGYLACGNRDGCVAVYYINKITEKPRLLNHVINCHQAGREEVSAVEIITKSSKPYVVTASCKDSALNITQITPEHNVLDCLEDTKVSEYIDIPQSYGLRCMALNEAEDRIAIGPNGMNKPVLLNIETGQLLSPEHTLNKKQAVRDVLWHNCDTITYVTHSGRLQCYDTRSDTIVYNAMDPFQCTLYCVRTDGQMSIIAGSSEYSRCVLFDQRQPMRLVQMYFTQKKSSPIYSLDFDSTKLIAAADRSVAVLNFNINSTSVAQRDYSDQFFFVNN